MGLTLAWNRPGPRLEPSDAARAAPLLTQRGVPAGAGRTDDDHVKNGNEAGVSPQARGANHARTLKGALVPGVSPRA